MKPLYLSTVKFLKIREQTLKVHSVLWGKPSKEFYQLKIPPPHLKTMETSVALKLDLGKPQKKLLFNGSVIKEGGGG